MSLGILDIVSLLKIGLLEIQNLVYHLLYDSFGPDLLTVQLMFFKSNQFSKSVNAGWEHIKFFCLKNLPNEISKGVGSPSGQETPTLIEFLGSLILKKN